MSDTAQNRFGPYPSDTGHFLPTTTPFRSPSGLATALTALFALIIGVDLLASAFDLNVWRLMDEVEGGSTVPDADLTRADNLQGLTGVLQATAMVATAVVFLVWFHQVRKNADFFALDACRMKSGWAIGSWFVPIGNLWLPRRVASEVWQASTDWNPEARPASAAPVNIWWTLFVAAWMVGRVAGRLYVDAETPEALRQAAGIMAFSDLLDAAAAVFALLFVRKLTRMQLGKAASYQEQYPFSQP